MFYIMAELKIKLLFGILIGLCATAFLCIGFIFVFQSDVYRYLYINENKNRAFETLTNVQLRLNQNSYTENFKDFNLCLKSYNQILYPNIYIANILTDRNKLTNQFLSIHKTLQVQSVYSILDCEILYNIIKDQICLNYNYNVTT